MKPPEYTDVTGLVPIASQTGRWLGHRWMVDAGMGHTRCGRYGGDRLPDPERDLPFSTPTVDINQCGACIRADETRKAPAS